eukprot:gene3211-4552_t
MDWQEGKFLDGDREFIVCSIHGASYDPRNGRCAGGPCAKGRLTALRVEERDAQVYWYPSADTQPAPPAVCVHRGDHPAGHWGALPLPAGRRNRRSPAARLYRTAARQRSFAAAPGRHARTRCRHRDPNPDRGVGAGSAGGGLPYRGRHCRRRLREPLGQGAVRG